MSAGESTVAARVPAEFRAEIEARVEELRAAGVHYPDGREVDLSYVLRVGLRAFLDGDFVAGNGRAFVGSLELGVASVVQGDRLGNLDHEPRAHAADPDTSKRAAAQAWPRANSDRHRALELLFAAGANGMTGDELDVQLGGYNGRRRLSDLKAGGWVEERRHRKSGPPLRGDENTGPRTIGDPVARLTRNRAYAGVYVLSAEAEVRVRDERAAVGGRGATDG